MLVVLVVVLGLVHLDVPLARVGDWDGACVVVGGLSDYVCWGWRVEGGLSRIESSVWCPIQRLVDWLLLDLYGDSLLQSLVRPSPGLDKHLMVLLHQQILLDYNLFLFVSDRDLGAIMNGVGCTSGSVVWLSRDLFLDYDGRLLRN